MRRIFVFLLACVIILSSALAGIAVSSVELDDDDAIDVVLNSDGTATADGSTVPSYDYVWHADPQHPAEYWTLGINGTTEFDSDAYEDAITSTNNGLYIAHDVRYTPNTLNFSTSNTAKKDEDTEYVVYYDASEPSVAAAIAELGTTYGSAYSTDKYIFATLPMQNGNTPPGGGGMPGDDRPGRMPMMATATDSTIAAMSTMTHSASDAYNNPVLHITKAGTYRISGTWHGQIWIETGAKAQHQVALILNGVEVSCDVAPALVFYKVYKWAENGGQGYDTQSVLAANDLWKSLGDKMVSSDGFYDVGAIVEIADGTTNTFTGANTYRILELSPKLDDDTDLPKYSASEIGSNISAQQKMYKLDGAFHSRRTMVIGGGSAGTGKLNITSTTCEGLDSEMHMLIDGGVISVSAPDDGINVNEDYVSVFTMKSGTLTVSSTGGDGIDSNGWVAFNGGTLNITAGSQRQNSAGEAGIDAENGVYIYNSNAYTWSASGSGGNDPRPERPDAPIITTESLSSATVGTAYSAKLEATSNSPITWTVYSGSLPTGLTLNPSTGEISGIPSLPGEFTFMLAASNSAGRASQTFTLTVEPEDVPVVIASEALNPAETGQPYSHSLKASGAPTSWSVTSGVLPAGLTLSADGVITGTVSTDAIESNAESGKVYSFDITAENAAGSDTKTFSITVYQPVRIITEALPNAKEGEEYYAEIEAEGTRDTFTQNVTSTIPPGLEYGTSETGKITLKGTPSIAGNYSVAAVFANRWSTVEESFTLTVEGKTTSTAKPRITIPKTDDYLIAGKDYSFQFGTSGNAPVIWAVTGNVPAGLSFDASTGKLSGKAEATDEGKYSYSPMSYSFTITATNSGGTDSADVYMKVYYPPEFAASSLPNATLNAGYKAEITAEGTEQGMTWAASSMNLPEGLTLTTSKNNRKCTITGVPHEIGTSSFTLKLSNTAGSTSEKVFILRVSEASPEETGKPTISTQSLYNGEISVQYVAFLEAAGRRPITWSRSGGKLPKGLTLDSYGAIKGVPTKAGTYNFTVTAANSEGSSSQNFTIVVTGDKYKKPKISTRKIPDATQNQPYSVQLACTGTEPITWSLANNKQPSGIYVTEDGRITGIPKEAGKFRIKVKAENNIGSATRTFSLKVDGIAPKILTDDLPIGTKKVSYNAQLVADGTDPVKWSKSGSFPSALKLNTKTGAITGKPRKANTYGFKITAKNKYGKYTKSFVIIVTDEAQETSSTTSAVIEPSTAIALDYPQEYSEPEIFPNHESEIDLFVVSGDEELRGEIYAPEGKPLTFKIGAEAEDVEVYIADEAIAIDVEDDGTFILPGELVSDEFVIYAVSDGVKTIELYIVAEEEE